MIGLYLLASHLVGDFLLQTRWQAAGKLNDHVVRARHVGAYTLAFFPVAVTQAPNAQAAYTFLAFLAALHFITDSRRFYSTFGDVFAWRTDPKTRPLRLSPNPWTPIPILIDQTLHVAQIAILGGIFLG